MTVEGKPMSSMESLIEADFSTSGKARVPRVGHLPSGPRDSLADVSGVTVGHCTLAQGDVQTGVTVIHPHAGNPFMHKVPAAASVLNGFGKSMGLVQVAELGVLETPIALTNTFSVAAVADAQIRQAIAANPDIGRTLPTVNPLVFECNDGYLNDIQAMAITQSHYQRACQNASTDVAQGSVGAGRGMSSFSFKGGIGTASRVARRQSPSPPTPALHAEPAACEASDPHAESVTPNCSPASATPWTVGALVLSNFGRLPNLTVAGRPFGQAWLAEQAATAQGLTPPQLAALAQVAAQTGTSQTGTSQTQAPSETPTADDAPEKGSIILVIATDAPLDARQLKRLSLRAGAGLARTGSVFGHGSGDIALAFSTAYTVPQDARTPMPAIAMLHETGLDPLFEAAAEACEQAIIHALWSAETVQGRDNHVRQALPEAMHHWREWLDTTALNPIRSHPDSP